MADTPSFLAELKRRNVLRVAAFYAAAGWLLVQFATQVFPFFNVPNEIVRGLVLVIALGFPFALVFSWFYELTPQGLKRESEIQRDESITRQTGKHLDRWIIGAIVLLGAFLIASRFIPQKTEAGTASVPPSTQPAATGAPASAAIPAPAKSVAVLPFENLSEEKANEYFASGMQDMILTKLAAIGDLKVISRTSTEKYKSHPDNLKTVAAELGVATLLEGSVQKAGNQVLINVQLIDAASDQHLWADAYPRTLENIFGVEGEVAQKIAEALKAKLTPAETASVSKAPTQNAVAYDLYLQASTRANRAYDINPLVAAVLPGAIALYEKALENDPNFALAAADLAKAHMYMFFYAPDRTPARLDAAKAAAERALALQPDLGEGHLALGLYYYWGHRDYAAATAQLQMARHELPSSAEVVQTLAAVERRQGHWDEGLAGFLAARTLDPRDTSANDQLGLTYQSLRRFAEADAVFARSVAIGRDPVDERRIRAFNSVSWTGDLQPVRAFIAELVPGTDSYTSAGFAMYLERWWSRDAAGAVRIAEADKNDDWIDGDNLVLPRRLYLARALQAAGEAGKAATVYQDVQARMRTALVAQPDNAGSHLALGFAEAGLGNKAQAIAEGERAAALVPIATDGITGPDYLAHLAALYVFVGEPDKAIAAIGRVMAVPAGSSMSSASLKLDPVWDPLRKDPRFAQLLSADEAGAQETKVTK
jgi:TolB-like protein/Flp pilus assembly protein TadD